MRCCAKDWLGGTSGARRAGRATSAQPAAPLSAAPLPAASWPVWPWPAFLRAVPAAVRVRWTLRGPRRSPVRHRPPPRIPRARLRPIKTAIPAPPRPISSRSSARRTRTAHPLATVSHIQRRTPERSPSRRSSPLPRVLPALALTAWIPRPPRLPPLPVRQICRRPPLTARRQMLLPPSTPTLARGVRSAAVFRTRVHRTRAFRTERTERFRQQASRCGAGPPALAWSRMPAPRQQGTPA